MMFKLWFLVWLSWVSSSEFVVNLRLLLATEDVGDKSWIDAEVGLLKVRNR
jgi:hypothetical protein